MKIIRSAQALQKEMRALKRAGKSIGFVPTMGALHEGHFSLVRKSVAKNDCTVVSIFVNPLQFAPGEDLDKYPRTFKADKAGLIAEGADYIFYPQSSTFYAPDHQTYVSNSAVQHLYCGAHRAGHFDGVLTVVAKLFNAVMPDVAYFGKKDYQQAFLISKMVRDLDFPLKIVTVETVREASGLARSSRNTYLSDVQRTAATAISRGLKKAHAQKNSGECSVSRLKTIIKREIEASGSTGIQYIEIASRATLLPLSGMLKEPAVALVAAYYGATRLIDNREL